MAFGQFVDEGDAGFERHHGSEFFLVRRQGRNPVEHQAGADHGCGATLEIEKAGGVAEVDGEFAWEFLLDFLGEVIEFSELTSGEFDIFIGDW